jgi:uncharacterized membrane protein
LKEAFALVMAFAGSFFTNYSTYLQKKAVDTLPAMRVKTSWPVIKAFVTNVPWLRAMAMDGLGTGLYLVALIFLPVSVVEPILTAGIAILAYLAITRLGEQPSSADYAAIVMTVLGVVLLAISLAEGLQKGKPYHAVELFVVTGVIIGMAVALPLIAAVAHRGSVAPALGFSGGLFIGVAAVYSRLLMGNFGGNWYVWLAACLVTYPVGFLVFQTGLQRGRAVVVAPIYNALVMCVPVVVGMLALEENLPDSPVLSAFRISAFVLIIAGTVILSRGTAGVALEKTPDSE